MINFIKTFLNIRLTVARYVHVMIHFLAHFVRGLVIKFVFRIPRSYPKQGGIVTYFMAKDNIILFMYLERVLKL